MYITKFNSFVFFAVPDRPEPVDGKKRAEEILKPYDTIGEFFSFFQSQIDHIIDTLSNNRSHQCHLYISKRRNHFRHCTFYNY